MLLGGAASVAIVNRTEEKAVALAELLASVGDGADVGAVALQSSEAAEVVSAASIVIDCTSVGMYPNIDVPPVVDAHWLHEGQLVCDLTYNPRETVLLKSAAVRGAETLDGTGMLVHQGAIAFEHWTGRAAPVETMRAALLRCLDERAAASEKN
jgi:shikimate dehydrogenase